MTESLFVPVDFVVPMSLDRPGFRLVPLGPEHNEADFEAWSNSIEHIRATTGFESHSWPHEMSVEQNLADLEQHAHDFVSRVGFTYTVLPADDAEGASVLGCVYIYPIKLSEQAQPGRAQVRSWVRGDHAALDVVLYAAVRNWLRSAWPFDAVDYASR